MRRDNYRVVSNDYECFNPRTRKGCDFEDKASPNDSNPVSIHAPVKDATLNIEWLILGEEVSIHAPVKDATMEKF